jgi:hypothetical protein
MTEQEKPILWTQVADMDIISLILKDNLKILN